ncbi:C39 family peptidase [Candidatus Wolfebacteria bacterium]|nr:C39 family peptidase [Candidatus Wolfebacteria bacterium]
MKKIALMAFFGAILVIGISLQSIFSDQKTGDRTAAVSESVSPAFTAPVAASQDLPSKKALQIGYHVFQTFNNCAPAALSITLSYYGIRASQEELAADLRPYNNPKGINDDKSTPPEELTEKAREYGLIPYFRANGSIDLLRQFIANDIPVIVRTLLYPDKDYAHYRVIKGYDDTTKEIIQDDSFEGKNLRFSYGKFEKLWQKFNYAYLILVPRDKQEVIEAILGGDLDAATSWRNALTKAEREIDINPDDERARFNASVAAYYTGDYARAIEEFEKVEPTLPRLTLWYQMEPIEAYFELGDDRRVLSLTTEVLSGNVSYSELYLLRGKVFLKQGNRERARQEFEKALFYNKNSKTAIRALDALD